MGVKLVRLHERAPLTHPHEGQPFYMKGKDLPPQLHGGPVEVKDIDPNRLQLRDKGTHGRGFYTTSNHDLAKGYADNTLRRDRAKGVVTIKHADPEAHVLVAGEHEESSHPSLVSAVKEFSPKYAKTGDVGMGEMTWRNQVNKFAEHHGYHAIQFKGKQDGKDVDHVVWKDHSKLRHAGVSEGAQGRLLGLDARVVGALDDTLRRKPWKGSDNPHAGHCYVASEAAYHLMGGKGSGWQSMHMQHEGSSHWFLKHKDTGEIKDLTAGQFNEPPDYSKAKPVGFLTKNPSKRAQVVINRVNGIKESKMKIKLVEAKRIKDEYPNPKGIVSADIHPKHNPVSHEDGPNTLGVSHEQMVQNIMAKYNKADAQTRKDGDEWYEKNHKLAVGLGNGLAHPHPLGGAHAGAGILSAYSPQTEWDTNRVNASTAVLNHRGHGGTGQGAMESHGQKAHMIMGHPAEESATCRHCAGEKAMNAKMPKRRRRDESKIGTPHNYNDVLTGEKTNAFAELLEHGGRDPHDKSKHNQRVCVDTHSTSVALRGEGEARLTANSPEVKKVQSDNLEGRVQYKHIEHAHQEAARRLSIQHGREIAPHQVQATTWLQHQMDHGLFDKNRNMVLGLQNSVRTKEVALRTPKHPLHGSNTPIHQPRTSPNARDTAGLSSHSCPSCSKTEALCAAVASYMYKGGALEEVYSKLNSVMLTESRVRLFKLNESSALTRHGYGKKYGQQRPGTPRGKMATFQKLAATERKFGFASGGYHDTAMNLSKEYRKKAQKLPEDSRPEVRLFKLSESAESACEQCAHPKGKHSLGLCKECTHPTGKYHEYHVAAIPVEWTKIVSALAAKGKDVGSSRKPAQRANRKKGYVKEDIVACRTCGMGRHEEDPCPNCEKEAKRIEIEQGERAAKWKKAAKHEGIDEAKKKMKVWSVEAHSKETHVARQPELGDKIPQHEIAGKDLGKFYHGTGDTGIQEIDPRRVNKNDSGFFGKGYYGTTDKESTRFYGGRRRVHELQPNAKVLRYHREVSKNQPEFVEKVKQHALKHLPQISQLHSQDVDGIDVDMATSDDNKSYFPHLWDHMVRHYSNHHNYDAVHIIHHSYNKPELTYKDYNERDEVRVRNLSALNGPEAQRKLPVLGKYINYNKPTKFSTTANAYSPSGKQYKKLKLKRKEDQPVDGISLK